MIEPYGQNRFGCVKVSVIAERSFWTGRQFQCRAVKETLLVRRDAPPPWGPDIISASPVRPSCPTDRCSWSAIWDSESPERTVWQSRRDRSHLSNFGNSAIGSMRVRLHWTSGKIYFKLEMNPRYGPCARKPADKRIRRGRLEIPIAGIGRQCTWWAPIICQDGPDGRSFHSDVMPRCGGSV